MSVQFSGKLDPADQVEALVGGYRQRLIVPLERVVIGDAEDGYAGTKGLRHKLRGRTTAVRFVSVRVEIDQS